MKKEVCKKDVKKAMLLALCPGLGMLYLEELKYFFAFILLTAMPLIGLSQMGGKAILGSVLMYVVSIYYTYIKVQETQRNKLTLKKDPYYILCLSFLFDGLGQFVLGQRKKGFIFMGIGFTTCFVISCLVISSVGFMEFVLVREGQTFMMANFLFTWLWVSVPIKVLCLIDAYYSTYHLYAVKKADK